MSDRQDPDSAAAELVREHGPDAINVARAEMQNAMKADDTNKAGFWMAVLYCIEMMPSTQSH